MEVQSGEPIIPGTLRVRFTERRRRDVLTRDWLALFQRLAGLAETYSADGVRLIVWFAF
jgi:hypothetical protein